MSKGMQYTRLGRTGLTVSRLCLGCMTYGVPERGAHPWTLPEDQSRPLIRLAVERGINFFDTANSYSDGTSEEIVGRALRDFARRDEIVVATKVRFGARRAPNIGGLSRKTVFNEIDGSLKRLGMDHVDLYQIHRWDPDTPIEETMEALHDVVKAGKARYLGASSMHAWQFAKAQAVARSLCTRLQQAAIPHAAQPQHGTLTISQGIGCIRPTLTDCADRFLTQVDDRLYAAKHRGRNCWEAQDF